MRSDSFRSFFSLSRMLAVAAVAIAASVVHRISDTFKVIALEVVSVLAPAAKADEVPGLGAPQRVLQAAQAFYLRMVKRERPSVRSTYRMCPSC